MQISDIFQLSYDLLDAKSVSMNSWQIPISHRATHISTKLESVCDLTTQYYKATINKP